MTDNPQQATRESLIEFPCAFPIKVMGDHSEEDIAEIHAIARQFDPGYDESSCELRPSSTGRYIGITITVQAINQQQLDDLYRALTSHPRSKVVL